MKVFRFGTEAVFLFLIVCPFCLSSENPVNLDFNVILSPLKFFWKHSFTFLTKLTNFEDFISEADNSTDFGDAETCFRHVIDLMIGLMDNKMWAVKMLDASSKIPSGIIAGNVIDLGAYEECVSLKTDQEFAGEYCFGKLILYYKNESTNPFRNVLLGGEANIKFSICVPSSCSPHLIQYFINDTISDLTKDNDIRINYVLQPNDCYVRREKAEPLGTSEWIALTVVLAVAVITIFSTFIHFCKIGEQEPSAYMVAFSLKKNINALFDTNIEPNSIRILYGLRFVNMVWVILANRYQFFSEQPIANAIYTIELFKQWSTMVVFSTPLASDSFLVISGFLNAYLTLPDLKEGKIPFIRNFIFRYLRLTPPLAAMQAITALLLYRLGEGPLWNQVVLPEVQNCRQYWYTGLAYISNYYNPNSSCMKQSWYMAVNMQLFFLSPLLLYPLSKWKFIGYILLAFSLIASILVPFYIAYVDGIVSPITISRNESLVNYENQVSFVPTHMRMSSYLVGLACGYFMFRSKLNNGRIEMRRIYRVLMCMGTCVLQILAVFGCYRLYQLDHSYDRIESSVYISLHRIAWSIGVAWIIVDSFSGKPGVFVNIMCSKLFIPLGRLTYCLYLVYMTNLLYEFGSTESPIYYTLFGTIHQFFGDVIMDLIFAFLLCILVEMPMLNILRETRSRMLTVRI